jgi:hypothetical protein
LKRELEVLKRRSEKKKKIGLTKFFTRHFTSRKLNDKISSGTDVATDGSVTAMENESVAMTKNSFETTVKSGVSNEGTPSVTRDPNIPRYAETTVTTIAPPSMARGFIGSLDQASSEDSVDEDAAQTTTQVLAKLSQTFVTEEPTKMLETVEAEAAEVDTTMPPASELERVPSNASTTASKSTFVTMPKFRKVQSMDARIYSPSYTSSKDSPLPSMRTFSRVLEEEDENGQVETVETMEDAVLVPTTSQVAA